MLTKLLPVALALAVVFGALAELAFTNSRVYSIASAPKDSDTAIVTVTGKITPLSNNVFILRDNTGQAELQTCPKWYQPVELQKNEQVTVTGEIIRHVTPLEGTMYAIAVHKISREGQPDIIIRTDMGKPPWAKKIEP